MNLIQLHFPHPATSKSFQLSPDAGLQENNIYKEMQLKNKKVKML